MGNAVSLVANRRHKGCSLPTPDLVVRMQPFRPSLTDKAMVARFGISYATYRKLLEGRPIRSSLISRLEVRVRQLEAGPASV